MIKETSAGIVLFRKEGTKKLFCYYIIHQDIGIL